MVNKASAGFFSTVEDYVKFAERLIIDGLRSGTMDDLRTGIVKVYCWIIKAFILNSLGKE